MAHLCQLWTKSVKYHWVILSNTCHSGHPNIKRPNRKIESTNFDQLKYTFCRSTKMTKKSQLRHNQTLTRWTGRVCSPTFVQLFCFFWCRPTLLAQRVKVWLCRNWLFFIILVDLQNVYFSWAKFVRSIFRFGIINIRVPGVTRVTRNYPVIFYRCSPKLAHMSHSSLNIFSQNFIKIGECTVKLSAFD